MDNEYLTICNDVSVHMTPTGISLFYQTFDPREVQKNIELSHHEKIILSKANGNTTVSNIRIDCESFIECRKFDLILQELIAKRMVVLTREKTKTKITGSKDYYVPRHISFEITSTCNFKCRHCYRDADSSQKEFIPKHDLLRFIGEAATNGVKIVEITGGECLMHPDAIEIIKGVADNPNLWIVAVLTNGWSLSDSLIEEFKGYERKVVFSVSLDSSVRDFHDDFRGMQGSWDRATDGIRKLSSKGFLCRASMSYIPASFFDIENTLLLAKELGAQCFGFSPVMPDGRGSVYAELFQKFSELVSSPQYVEYLTRLNSKYAGYIVRFDNEFVDNIKCGKENCGLGHRSWAISPGGDVRPCVMMPQRLISLGNIKTDKFLDICKGEVINLLHDVPSPNLKDCEGCKSINICPHCIYQGIKQYWKTGSCKLSEANRAYKRLLDLAVKNSSVIVTTCKSCN